MKHDFIIKAIGFWALLSMTFSMADAAIPKPQKASKMERQIGGMAGPGFSLLNLTRKEAKSGKTERLVFSIGDRDGNTLKGRPGYFNAQNQGRRIVLDFSQMAYSRLSEDTVRDLMKGSKLVKSVKMMKDPHDQTLTVVLDFKSPVKMRTLQVKGEKQTAQVILDIMKR